jgi:phage gp29-like protein
LGVFRRLGQWAALRFGRAPQPRSIGARPPRDQSRWPQWLSAGLTLDRMASITKLADQGSLGDLMALEQEIAGRDPLVSGLLTTRLSALSQRPVKTAPSKADRDPQRAQAVADFGQTVLDGLRVARREGDRTRTEKGLAGVVEGLAMASYYGAEVGWVHWGLRPGDPRPRPLAVELIDERRLCVDPHTEALAIATESSGSRGVPLCTFDPALVLEVRSTRISRRVAMAGAARACLLPWWIRFGSIKDLTSYLETWAKPSLVGKTSGDAPASYGSDALDTFKNLLEDFLGDTRAILPPGFDLEVVGAVAGGEAVFEAVDRLTERHLCFALVGQTGTAAGEGGSLAKAEVNERVREDLTEGDARMVGEALECLLSSAVAVEFGPGVPPPCVEFELGQDAEALSQRAAMLGAVGEAVTSLKRAGVPVDIRAVAEEFLIPMLAPAAEPAPEAPTLAPTPEGQP